MTTDTIPEAREAMRQINLAAEDPDESYSTFGEHQIAQACLAYHKRRLAGCSGDASHLLPQIAAAMDVSYGPAMTKPVSELLQLHTAKAVEEATVQLRHELIMIRDSLSDVSKKYNDAVAKIPKRAVIEELENKAAMEKGLATIYKSDKEVLRKEIATLQKQCEELRQAVELLKRQHELVKNERDSWKTASECEHADKLAVVKERDELRTRVNELERFLQLKKDNYEVYAEMLVRAEKAEMELSRRNQFAAEWLAQENKQRPQTDEEWIKWVESFLSQMSKREKAEAQLDAYIKEDIDQLTQLQKDVRPLLSYFIGHGNYVFRQQMLKTFLAKHPDLKP